MAVATDDACAVLAAMTSRGRSDSKPVGACVKGVGTSRMLGLESMFSGTASACGSQGGAQTPSKDGHRMISNSARARVQRSIPVRHPILHYFVSHRASGGKQTVLSSQPSANTGCLWCRNVLAGTYAIGNSILKDRRNVQDLHDRAYQNRSQMLSITIKNWRLPMNTSSFVTRRRGPFLVDSSRMVTHTDCPSPSRGGMS